METKFRTVWLAISMARKQEGKKEHNLEDKTLEVHRGTETKNRLNEDIDTKELRGQHKN